MKKLFSVMIIALLISPLISHAAWVTIQTKINKITTFTDRDYIMVTVEDTSFPIPELCTTRAFAIPPTIPENRRNQVLSILLSAQAQKADISITFSDSDCVPWTSGDTQYLRLVRVAI